MPGQFFRRDEVSDLVANLDGMHRKLESLVKGGEVGEGGPALRGPAHRGLCQN